VVKILYPPKYGIKNMEKFNFREESIKFWEVTGEVIGSDKFSETRVSSSGGGGYISPNGGRIQTPTVRSSSVTNHEFWMKTDDGLEKDISIRGSDIPLRTGQRVTIISAGREEANSGYYSVLVNHTAGKHWFINTAEQLNRSWELFLVGGWTFLTACVMFPAIWYFVPPSKEIGHLSGFLTSLFLTISFLAIRFSILGGIRSEFHQKLQAHLESLAQYTYKNLKEDQNTAGKMEVEQLKTREYGD